MTLIKNTEVFKRYQAERDQLLQRISQINDMLDSTIDESVTKWEVFSTLIATCTRQEYEVYITSDGNRIWVEKRQLTGQNIKEEWIEGNRYLYNCFKICEKLIKANVHPNELLFYKVGCVNWVRYSSMISIFKHCPKGVKAIMNGQFKVTNK